MEHVIKNYSKIVSVTPVISTSAYTTGDQIGGIQTLSDAILYDSESKGAIITDICIIDADSQSAPIDIFFFRTLPTVASVDNGAATITDAEMAEKCIGHVSVLAGDYATLASNALATVRNVSLLVRSTQDDASVINMKQVYAVAVIRATKTYTTTSSVTFKYGLLQD